MSSDAVTYDEVLPERATVPCECSMHHLRPAEEGDTIEVDCPACQGEIFLTCDRCFGAGTLRVRLTEDPAPWFGHDLMDHEQPAGWRHVGTVVTDA